MPARKSKVPPTPTATGTPSRKRYAITSKGRAELRAKRSEWAAFSDAMAMVLGTPRKSRAK